MSRPSPDDERGKQKGAQTHPDGSHGDRTHQAKQQEINANGARTGDEAAETAHEVATRAGKHKIHEDRQQHDEADKNSQKNRLRHDRDLGRVPDQA